MQAHKGSHRVAREGKDNSPATMPAKPKRFAGALGHFMKNLFNSRVFQRLGYIIKLPHGYSPAKQQYIVILQAVLYLLPGNFRIIRNVNNIGLKRMLLQNSLCSITVSCSDLVRSWRLVY